MIKNLNKQKLRKNSNRKQVFSLEDNPWECVQENYKFSMVSENLF